MPVDAATSAYAWLRDGAVLRGATGPVRALSRFDRGHALTCRATARTAWGSTTMAAAAVPSPVHGSRHRGPACRGTARLGARLRCSGGIRVDWLRDGRLVGGTHARHYLVRARDAGRAIACEAQLRRRDRHALARRQGSAFVRRLIVIATVLACLALPAPGLAQVPGFREVALPATLHDILFAADGTIYGTADSHGTPSRNPGVVWRSSDHGRTWSAAYSWPIGWSVHLLQVSPADPTIVYASVSPPGPEATTVTRIDTRAGIATPLSIGGWTGKGDWHSSLPRPHSSWSGMDAAGTAYALDMLDNKAMLVRCRERRDTCDRVPILFAGGGEINFLSVDPNAAGVLVATNRRADGLGTFLEVSVDGGASWTQGVAVPGGNVVFAGPGVRTLYQFQSGLSGSPGTVFVSHDAGLSWYSQYPAPKGSLIVGSRPSVGIGLGPGPLVAIGDDGVSGQVGTTPIASWPVVDPPTRRASSCSARPRRSSRRIAGRHGASWRARSSA